MIIKAANKVSANTRQYHPRSQRVDPTDLGVARDSNKGTEQPVQLPTTEQCHRHKDLTTRHSSRDLTTPRRHKQTQVSGSNTSTVGAPIQKEYTVRLRRSTHRKLTEAPIQKEMIAISIPVQNKVTNMFL
mmetsp:Transcript_64283/g.76089  ORF Transcript_64283/g.76089 Transcript_64283/m.76089 type:complete len:130 (-) Transcript_64283:501-890(-)